MSDLSAPEDEFADYDGRLIAPTQTLDLRRMLDPATLRGLATLVGGLVVLFSDRSARTLAVVIGVIFVIWAATEAGSIPAGTRRGQKIGTAILIAAFGIAVAVWPDVTGRLLSRLVGTGVAVLGVRDLVRAYRGGADTGVDKWGVVRSVLIVALGIALWIAPSVLLNVVLALFALAWVVTGIATVVTNLSSRGESVDITESWFRFFEWLEARPHTADDRSQLYAKLFFEGPDVKRRTSRFFLLMGFATTIAAYGIASDSTAVVIGAMLIAPLMTPLMATSLSLVMGWPKRTLISAFVALGGVVLAISLAIVFGAILPFELDPETNSQISSRVAPTLVDLIIAVAAGGAGAFALSRPDVSDALPGVAVAIALVPPLAVVGLMIEAGEAEAIGALLLFITNMVAILLVGAFVFVLTGVVPVRHLISRRERVRTSAALIGILAVVVIVVLGSTGERIRAQAFDRSEAERVVDEWIGGQSLRVFDVDVSQEAIEVVIVGGDTPDSPGDLADDLREALNRDLEVVVRWVPEQRFEFDGGD